MLFSVLALSCAQLKLDSFGFFGPCLIFLTRRSATRSVDIPLVRATCSVSVPFCFSRSSHSESLVLPLDFRSLPPVSRASAPVFGVILVRPCRRTLFPSLPFDYFAGESVPCAVREFCPSSALFLPRLAVRPGASIRSRLTQTGCLFARVPPRARPAGRGQSWASAVATLSCDRCRLVPRAGRPRFKLACVFASDQIVLRFPLCGMVAGEASVLLSCRIERDFILQITLSR
jgi:hypothetical protein